MNISPTRTIDVHAVSDPALDLAAMGGELGRYLLTRDPALARARPGMELRRYTMAALSHRALHYYVMDGTSEHERWKRAFCASVRGVYGIWDHETGQHRMQTWIPARTMKRSELEVDVWPDDVLEVVRPDVVYELGKWALDRCSLEEQHGDFFELPPGLAALMQQRISRAALMARATQRRLQSSETRSAETTAATADPSDGVAHEPLP